MASKKTEEELLTAEILKLRRRLSKMNLAHLEITGITFKPQDKAKKCEQGFEPRMVQMSDGSFKLKCVKIL